MNFQLCTDRHNFYTFRGVSWCLATWPVLHKVRNKAFWILSIISFSHAIALCFPRACVGLIGPRPPDYPHALSFCYYFLQAVFLPALGLWSSLPARQLSLDTSYSFLTFSGFFCFFCTERIDESYIKAPTATSNCRLTTSEDAWAFFGR